MPSSGGNREPSSGITPTRSATSSMKSRAGPPASRSRRSFWRRCPGRWAPDELYFGMPESEHHRLARLEDEEGSAEASAEMMSSLPPDLPMFKAAPMTLYPTAELGNRTDVLIADIPPSTW